MFGLFKSFDDEYLELYEYLTQDWGMRPEYAKPFLTTYKKSVGKRLHLLKKQNDKLLNSKTPGSTLLAIAQFGAGDEQVYALVVQAHWAYMNDLRRGKHVGTNVEKTIWAILTNRSDLVEQVDRPFAKYIEKTSQEKYPSLFEEVFQD
ncbi:hypothetical protein ACK3Y4_10820 [Aeromonas caviae]